MLISDFKRCQRIEGVVKVTDLYCGKLLHISNFYNDISQCRNCKRLMNSRYKKRSKCPEILTQCKILRKDLRHKNKEMNTLLNLEEKIKNDKNRILFEIENLKDNIFILERLA